jgi:hypothetical protein
MIAEIITLRRENAELWEFVRSTFLEPARAASGKGHPH